MVSADETVRYGLGVMLGYFCGSVPFGVLLTRRLPGVDVRTQGSGNIGATNVARVAGRKRGGLVLALDAMKGLVPALAAKGLFPDRPRLQIAVALAAVLGHVFPVWLGFRGGKGVATGLGVLLALQPWAALVGAVTYALVFAASRVSSVGSLLGAVAALVTAFQVPGPRADAYFVLTLMGLVIFTHRGNLARLWKRAEKRL